MHSRRHALIAALALATQLLVPVAGAATCSDIPIWVTILPVEGSVLAGDSKGTVYKAEADGTVFTRISICPNANYDATLSLAAGSERTMAITFPAPIPGSIIDGAAPAWANGGTFAAQPILYVRNILWGRMHGKYSFTTRLILKSIIGPGDDAPYDLRMQPSLVDALDNAPPFGDTNLPGETAAVIVQDVPGTCRSTPDGTLDSWIVTVNGPVSVTGGPRRRAVGKAVIPPFVGTLYAESPSHHSGQYVMPFKLLIEAQTCVPSSFTP